MPLSQSFLGMAFLHPFSVHMVHVQNAVAHVGNGGSGLRVVGDAAVVGGLITDGGVGVGGVVGDPGTVVGGSGGMSSQVGSPLSKRAQGLDMEYVLSPGLPIVCDMLLDEMMRLEWCIRTMTHQDFSSIPTTVPGLAMPFSVWDLTHTGVPNGRYRSHARRCSASPVCP